MSTLGAHDSGLMSVLLSALYKHGEGTTIRRDELTSDFEVSVESYPPHKPLDEAEALTIKVTKKAGG